MDSTSLTLLLTFFGTVGFSNRRFVHVQARTYRTEDVPTGAAAFFRDEKREHGLKLCELVYKKWLGVETELEWPFQELHLLNIDVQHDWKKGHTLSGEVFVKERRPAFYAIRHLEA